MRVSWVISAAGEIPTALDIDQIKTVGPVWGSWRTWRSCATDNVVCHDATKSRELLDRAFQAVCNFYVPRSHYELLQRPVGIRLYEGDYQQQMDDIEDIIVLQLAASTSDIVLLLGYDLGSINPVEDPLERHKQINRHGLIRSALATASQTQFVLIDFDRNLDKAYQDLPNLTCDTMTSVLKLLS